MILIPQQRSNEKHQTGMQMAVFPKKMGFCAIETSQTAWQESGAGEVLGKRDVCGRERSRWQSSSPCPLSPVRGLCYLFVQNTFYRVQQKSWNCYHTRVFFNNISLPVWKHPSAQHRSATSVRVPGGSGVAPCPQPQC